MRTALVLALVLAGRLAFADASTPDPPRPPRAEPRRRPDQPIKENAREMALARARREFEEGARAYELAEYEAAKAHFEKAYALSAVPIILFNIGQCEKMLGNQDAAVKRFREFLDKTPPGTRNRAEVEKLILGLTAPPR